MSFDPEKVRRYVALEPPMGGMWVRAEDYDALLTLYRDLAVSEASLKWLRTDDDSIESTQAKRIAELEAKLLDLETGGVAK